MSERPTFKERLKEEVRNTVEAVLVAGGFCLIGGMAGTGAFISNLPTVSEITDSYKDQAAKCIDGTTFLEAAQKTHQDPDVLKPKADKIEQSCRDTSELLEISESAAGTWRSDFILDPITLNSIATKKELEDSLRKVKTIKIAWEKDGK